MVSRFFILFALAAFFAVFGISAASIARAGDYSEEAVSKELDPRGTREHWTKERMDSAKPMPLPRHPEFVKPVPLSEMHSHICPNVMKRCPDGSFVSRVPPRCNFQPCPGKGSSGALPGGMACTQEGRECPDGSIVFRGPDCEFAPCPGKNQNPDRTPYKRK